MVAWCIGGLFIGFTDTYQLVINTGTTIITFLMVFLIQNTQNRDAAALHVKLDELIRVSEGRNEMIGLEDRAAKEIAEAKRDIDPHLP